MRELAFALLVVVGVAFGVVVLARLRLERRAELERHERETAAADELERAIARGARRARAHENARRAARLARRG